MLSVSPAAVEAGRISPSTTPLAEYVGGNLGSGRGRRKRLSIISPSRLLIRVSGMGSIVPNDADDRLREESAAGCTGKYALCSCSARWLV